MNMNKGIGINEHILCGYSLKTRGKYFKEHFKVTLQDLRGPF